VALAADDLLRCAALLGCPIEVNIYYRTAARMKALLDFLNERRRVMRVGPAPVGWENRRWQDVVENIPILGEDADGVISGLEGPRAICCRNGIEKADTILVPLEDGDRCNALIALEKQVIVVDLNPISRTARNATITIVDELSRVVPQLIDTLNGQAHLPNQNWNNDEIRQDVLRTMLESLNRDV
jgi:4-phosphopantoate--beta-alanine ligase